MNLEIWTFDVESKHEERASRTLWYIYMIVNNNIPMCVYYLTVSDTPFNYNVGIGN